MATKFLTLGTVLSCSLLFAVVGCGGGDDGDDGGSSSSVPLADQCSADIDAAVTEACGDDSGAAQLANIIKSFCATFLDTPDCRAKYNDYRSCLTQYEISCTTALPDDGGACDELGEPFGVSMGDGEGSRECVRN